MKKTYNLFLDDLRELGYVSNFLFPFNEKEWIVCRNSSEALGCIINNGIPKFISFDHDLGGEDTAMVFLKNWVSVFPDTPFPQYHIHSSNPIGRENIKSFVDSFNRSLEM